VPLGDILPELRRIASKVAAIDSKLSACRSLQILCFSRSRHVHPYTSCLTINLGNTLGDHYDFFRTIRTQKRQQNALIGGQPVVTLTRLKTGDGSKPEFLSAEVLPGRGMNLFQITAMCPAKERSLSFILRPSKRLRVFSEAPTTRMAQKASLRRSISGSFANRIIGPLSNDGKTVSFEWQGHPLRSMLMEGQEAGGRAACDSRPHSGFQNR